MKLIIFDCDGTLVDSQHIIVAAMNMAFEQHGLPKMQAGRVLSIVGLSLPLAIERLLPGAPAGQVDAVSDAYRAAFGHLRRDPAHHEPLYPGILELIRDLSARDDVLLGIATGKSVRGVTALLHRMALEDHFFTIQTADTHPSKPHPSMIETAIAEAGAEPGNTVMIGDTTFDMEMARLASVRAVGVGWGYHPPDDLHRTGASFVASDADHLHAGLTNLLGMAPPPNRKKPLMEPS
jgi:phosphoglycolate phosphatase